MKRSWTLMLIALAALTLAGLTQRRNESRRVAENLTSTDPANKEPLEAGLLALGGFRGLLADILWIRAISQQDAGRYYELKLLCDMIQRLQPTFVQVHAFQAYNMSYNLAFRSESCEDKWFWVRSGLQTLEKGLERNERNYGLWFELGYQYFDRLSDHRLYDKATQLDCRSTRAELPRFDDLTEAQLKRTFTDSHTWQKGRARPDEHYRFAAYYFYKSLQTMSEVHPLRTERVFGNCLDHLGHFRSKNVPIEQRKWSDWGSEDWWKRLIELNKQRGIPSEVSAPQNLKFTMNLQLDLHDRRVSAAHTSNDPDEALNSGKELAATFRRYQSYFPEEKRLMFQVLQDFRQASNKHTRYKETLKAK